LNPTRVLVAAPQSRILSRPRHSLRSHLSVIGTLEASPSCSCHALVRIATMTATKQSSSGDRARRSWART